MCRTGVTASFSAAHFLGAYRGTCEEIHGHNYRVEAVVGSEDLDRIGLSLDFRHLRKALQAVLKELGHRMLNETAQFREMNPSAENIARWIFEELSGALAEEGADLIEVRVWETPDAWAAYRPGPG